ncbi:PAS domain S-box-containing protein [Mucilaginibacter oryzae]|uniref:histidine kinase n=1 Tax=Mucilaginibacter oryzae TaxID=468058 RepID=A0A316HE14_9SPHI|nr:GAF domain-containing protein [Mucilaginibacter oryzae]PWK78736.1 PAS domain S-box-containing protein [Mucilaginibacter oryzae]
MPLRELERIAAVNRFLKLEISKDKELQGIVELAARICGTPTALITLIDENTQYIKFKIGFRYETTTRAEAFCNHVIENDGVMMVPDALLDERFATNPLVTGDPKIRFYAGSPLTTKDGLNLGSLCVIDRQPRDLNELQQQMLSALSRQAIQLLEFDSSIEILKDQFIAAKRSEIELRSFFESSIDCHLLLGKNFEILAFNKSLERLIYRTYNQTLVRGGDMHNYLAPQLKRCFYDNYLKALRGTAVFEERKIDHSAQQTYWVVKYEPAFNPQGEIIGVSVNATDVTARVKHEETVTAQNQSLREIAFIQSHELRRPVASIMGLMELLKTDERVTGIEELQLMEKAVQELDEKIHLVVSYTTEPPPQ